MFIIKVVLMRVPIHEIAGMSYIRDEDEHILVIKKGIYCYITVITCIMILHNSNLTLYR